MVETRRYRLVQTHRCTTSGGTPNVNHGLWVMMTYQRGIVTNVFTVGEAMHEWRQGEYRESLHLPLNFDVNLKMSFHNSKFKFKKRKPLPPKASETSLRDFAHSVLQESESVFVLTPWASGWLVHESGFELISR